MSARPVMAGAEGTPLFFYGTLRHPPLLAAVLGRTPQTGPARLAGHAARTVAGATWPAILAEDGARAEGLLLPDPTPGDVARLDFYEGAYHYALRAATVETAQGPRTARVYFPTDGHPPAAGPWRLEDWERDHAALATRAAIEVMESFGLRDAEALRAGYPQVLVRAASALRAAAEPAPATRRSAAGAATVEVVGRRRPYANYYAVLEEDVRFPLFGGGMSPAVTRAAFVLGDAATVLPWDPARDRVLLVEQFRYGAFARGDARPFSLEPVAGRIDAGESPEDAARREAREEARLELGALHEVARYYPSPGAVAEWLVSYVGIADLPDGCATVAGEESEAEDIRGHLVSLSEAMAMIETGEIANGPAILSLQWIALNRGRLGAGAARAPGLDGGGPL